LKPKTSTPKGTTFRVMCVRAARTKAKEIDRRKKKRKLQNRSQSVYPGRLACVQNNPCKRGTRKAKHRKMYRGTRRERISKNRRED